MSAATAARHSIKELIYVDADDLTNIVHFKARSESGANGPWNFAGLDTATGAAHCSCRGFAAGHDCWHVLLLARAWQAHPARRLAERYTSEQLLKVGRKMAHMCATYRARCFRCVPADQVALVAARCAYRERAALAEAPALAA